MCVDTDATQNIIGERKFKAYKKHYNLPIELKHSPSSFRFVIGINQSAGNFQARISLPKYPYGMQNIYNSNTFTILIGMEVLFNIFQFITGLWNTYAKFSRKLGNPNLLCYASLYTSIKRRWNLCFKDKNFSSCIIILCHHQQKRTVQSLKRSFPNKAKMEVLQLLQDILDNCKLCSAISVTSLWFSKPFLNMKNI